MRVFDKFCVYVSEMMDKVLQNAAVMTINRS